LLWLPSDCCEFLLLGCDNSSRFDFVLPESASSETTPEAIKSIMEAFEAQVEYEELVRLWQLTSPLRSIVPQVVASLLLRKFFDFFGELKKAAPLSRSAEPPFLFLYLFPGFSLKQDVILRS
jgi:hypothetical protein